MKRFVQELNAILSSSQLQVALRHNDQGSRNLIRDPEFKLCSLLKII